MKRRYRLWVKVTHDELELPVAVAASQSELAKMLGVSPKHHRRRIFACRKKRNLVGDKGG